MLHPLRSHFGSRLTGWTLLPPFRDPLAACGWGGKCGPVGLESRRRPRPARSGDWGRSRAVVLHALLLVRFCGPLCPLLLALFLKLCFVVVVSLCCFFSLCFVTFHVLALINCGAPFESIVRLLPDGGRCGGSWRLHADTTATAAAPCARWSLAAGALLGGLAASWAAHCHQGLGGANGS